MFIDLACDGVHDYCKPFSVVCGKQEVGQLLFELVGIFEVGDMCDELSFIRVNFALGHAVKCRGVSRMEWVDVGSFWGNEVVAEEVMTRPSSTCCLPPWRYVMELAYANISRCVCSIAAYVGFPGAVFRVE